MLWQTHTERAQRLTSRGLACPATNGQPRYAIDIEDSYAFTGRRLG